MFCPKCACYLSNNPKICPKCGIDIDRSKAMIMEAQIRTRRISPQQMRPSKDAEKLLSSYVDDDEYEPDDGGSNATICLGIGALCAVLCIIDAFLAGFLTRGAIFFVLAFITVAFGIIGLKLGRDGIRDGNYSLGMKWGSICSGIGVGITAIVTIICAIVQIITYISSGVFLR